MPRFLGRIAPSKARLAALPMFAALAPQLPAPPRQIILTEAEAAITYAGTLGNTTAGDCTIAGVLRLMQRWSATNGPALAFTDEQALAIYSQLEGYNPATGEPDNGLVETDVLDDWKGGLAGNTLAGYSSINPADLLHIQQTIDVYGGAYLGLMLPESAERQTDAGQPWTVPWFSPILGGHCVPAFEYDDYYLYCGTWALRQPVAWDFVLRYFDAAYAPADSLWLGPDGKTPGGLDLAALTADLPAVAN